MKSLVLTLDPHTQGGVIAMQRTMAAAHERLGLEPWLGYARAARRDRFDFRPKEGHVGRQPTLAVGYLPSIEYMNYAVPALSLRKRLDDFPIVQLVTGSHAASLIPIVAGRPFVSWVATPFCDEIASRHAADEPTLSVRINHRLQPLNDAIERWSYRFPGKVFALSSYTARRLADVTGLSPDRFDVLRMPADLAAFPLEGPRWQRAPGRYVVTVSRVDDARKNVSSLLRCFARLGERHRDVSLVVVGEVDPDSRVIKLARDLGIAERVVFPGILAGAELAAAYRGAEAYVMTSRQEGLGIVVLEAQASGRPPIVMRCGGSDELIDHGRTGWLVDQGDAAAFVRILDEVLSDEALGRRVGRAARDDVERSSSLAAFDQALRGAYAEVFGSFRAKPSGLAPPHASTATASIDRTRPNPSAT